MILPKCLSTGGADTTFTMLAHLTLNRRKSGFVSWEAACSTPSFQTVDGNLTVSVSIPRGLSCGFASSGVLSDQGGHEKHSSLNDEGEDRMARVSPQRERQGRFLQVGVAGLAR